MEKHDLHHEFPGMDARITALKVDNAHFKNWRMNTMKLITQFTE